MIDFEPKKMRQYFSEKLNEGKKIAANLRKSNNQSDA